MKMIRFFAKSLPVPLFLVVYFALSASAWGASLDEYSRQIEQAKTKTDDLIEVVSRANRNPTSEKDKALAIAVLLPATEKVEWQGGSIDTDNQWLPDAMGEFSKEVATALGKGILIGVSERLQAIDESIKQLQAAIASPHSKEDDKRKLAEILSRDEYQKPVQQDESLVQKWLREFWEWLSRHLPAPSMSPQTASGMEPVKLVIQVLIFLVVIGLIGFLVYKFLPLILKRFGDRTKEKKNDRVILGERIAADESAHELFSEAEGLARQGDLRGAIRKGYIAILCELSDRKIIGLARHKTNRDYLRDIHKRSDLFENVAALTGSYERNWYGLRQAEQLDWDDFRDRYRQTMAKV